MDLETKIMTNNVDAWCYVAREAALHIFLNSNPVPNSLAVYDIALSEQQVRKILFYDLKRLRVRNISFGKEASIASKTQQTMIKQILASKQLHTLLIYGSMIPFGDLYCFLYGKPCKQNRLVHNLVELELGAMKLLICNENHVTATREVNMFSKALKHCSSLRSLSLEQLVIQDKRKSATEKDRVGVVLLNIGDIGRTSFGSTNEVEEIQQEGDEMQYGKLKTLDLSRQLLTSFNLYLLSRGLRHAANLSRFSFTPKYVLEENRPGLLAVLARCAKTRLLLQHLNVSMLPFTTGLPFKEKRFVENLFKPQTKVSVV